MPEVVLGVCGGIAADTACELLRLFTESGHGVRVVPTASALKLVGAPGPCVPEAFAMTKSVMLCGGSVALSVLPAIGASARRTIALADVNCQASAVPR